MVLSYSEPAYFVWFDAKKIEIHITTDFSTPFYDNSGRFVVLGEL